METDEDERNRTGRRRKRTKMMREGQRGREKDDGEEKKTGSGEKGLR